MRATVTDKGQVTVPKEIRDKIGIIPGSKLDFELMGDGSLFVRVLSRGSDNLFGLVRRQNQLPLGIEKMDDGIAEAVNARNRQA
jgi:AbrB family looped-hinge helix DNA binding protein